MRFRCEGFRCLSVSSTEPFQDWVVYRFHAQHFQSSSVRITTSQWVLSFITILFRVAAAVVVAAAADEQWEKYKQDFNKVYTSDSEESERHALFTESLNRIAKLNAQGPNAVFGLTWTADRYPHEKHAKGLKRAKSRVANAPLYQKKQERRTLASIDWRDTKAVIPITLGHTSKGNQLLICAEV